VYNASTGNTLETENTERALQMCTKARHPDELPIYLEDLWPKAQKKVLEFLGIKTPQEANLDVLPLFMLPKPE
jgi:hypothetical protein